VSFFGIRLASRSLQAHQQALEVTGQNIANVNTPGYHRQVAILKPVPGATPLYLDRSGEPIAPGGGVDVARVHRTHALWLDRTAAELTAQLGQATVDERTSRQVEELLAEPTEAGVQSTIGRFLAAFGHLSNRPEDITARDGVLRSGKEVSARFQQLTEGLDALRQDMYTSAQESVTAINELAKQVAHLNEIISQAQGAGAQPNELLDQRDQLLQELNRRGGATHSGQTTGEVIVSIGGITIVQGQHSETLELSPGSPLTVVLRGTGQTVTPSGGELRAQQEWANTTLPQHRARVNAFRDQLAAAVNALHQSGRDAAGAAGLPFFTPDPGGNLQVNTALLADSRKVVAGDGTAGNGSVALSISGLGNVDGTVLPPYQTLVADIGARSSDDRRRREQTDASLLQVQTVQASESGVNLDEELAQMVQLQHAYAASARLLTSYDEMLTTLIERTGV
jgi:flagellar hook-associated protein 1 FlgK